MLTLRDLQDCSDEADFLRRPDCLWFRGGSGAVWCSAAHFGDPDSEALCHDSSLSPLKVGHRFWSV